MYIRFGISGSAFPETIHRELWNLYRQSSTATMSTRRIYLALLSNPETLTLNGGNIRLSTTTTKHTAVVIYRNHSQNETETCGENENGIESDAILRERLDRFL